MTESSPKLRDVELNARKLYLYSELSNEYLTDSPDSAQFLERAFSGAIGWNLDSVFITGDGAGKPLGVLNAGCTIEVSAETGQDASTFVYENATNMLGHLMPGSYPTAVWLIHPTVVEEVLEMGFSVGSGGSKIETLNPKTGKLQILGLDVIVTEFCNTLGTAGDVILADFSKYLVGMRRDFRMESSQHSKFQSDQAAFRGIARVDGAPVLNETLTLKDGSTEVSAFITVADRS
jgi:HK97 family phage major capsid protein